MANVTIGGIVVLALILAAGTLATIMTFYEGIKIYIERYVKNEDEEEPEP